MTEADYVDNQVLLANTQAQANTYWIAWSKQPEALTSTYTQIKQS